MKRTHLFFLLSFVLLGCQNVPVEPEESGRTSLKGFAETDSIEVQLWAGRVKYAAYVGGGEWRATFEAKVLQHGAENIRDQYEITFYWMAKLTKPSAHENGWIKGENPFGHGLMSIDGMWVDRVSHLTPPYWMRIQVSGNKPGATIDIIGMCNFLESVEQPGTVWISTADLGYDKGDRIMARVKVKAQ